MPDPMTWYAIAQGAGTGLNWLSQRLNRPKPFEETAYGRRLKQLMEQGIISPTARSNILGQVGAQTANVAEQVKTGYKGRLIAQGMGGSIAGQRGMTDIDVQRMGQMGQVAKDIETQNELSKAQYATEYAQAKSAYGQRLSEYDRSATAGLIQGAVGALGTYTQGLQQREQLKAAQTPEIWGKTLAGYRAKTERMLLEKRYPQLTPMPNNIFQMTPEQQDVWIARNAKSQSDVDLYYYILLGGTK